MSKPNIFLSAKVGHHVEYIFNATACFITKRLKCPCNRNERSVIIRMKALNEYLNLNIFLSSKIGHYTEHILMPLFVLQLKKVYFLANKISLKV